MKRRNVRLDTQPTNGAIGTRQEVRPRRSKSRLEAELADLACSPQIVHARRGAELSLGKQTIERFASDLDLLEQHFGRLEEELLGLVLPDRLDRDCGVSSTQ